MVIASVQMGTFSLGINGVFLTNSSWDPSLAYGFCVFKKPISQIGLNFVVVRKSWVFDGRKPKYSVLNALADGEVEAHSANTRLLGKEFNFSPTFTDYVKVMESVKTDRTKNLSEEMDEYDSKGKGNSVRTKRDSRKSGDSIDSSRRKLGREERVKDSKDVRRFVKNMKSAAVENNASGWGLVERILEKKTSAGNGDTGRGRLDFRGSNSDSNDISSSLCNGLSASSENVGRGYYEKRSVDRSATQSDRWKNSQKNGNSRKVDEFGVPGHSDDTFVHGTSAEITEKRWSRNNVGSGQQQISHGDTSKELYERLEHTRVLERDCTNSVREKIHFDEQRKDNRFLGSRVEKKTDEPGKKKSLPELKSSVRNSISRESEDSVVMENSYGSGKSYGANMHDRYEGHRNVMAHEISSRMNQRKTGGRENIREREISSRMDQTEGKLRKTERRILDKDTIFVKENGVKQNRMGHDIYASNTYMPAKEVHGQNRSQSHDRFHDGAAEGGFGFIELRGRSQQYNLQPSRTDRRETVDFEDRTAFKTFEVFTDVRNRPRVLRMEMEERIQTLAKRLNATDINMPEWQFSKMMHGAKIKFTDHSILRAVQILGALGNWKRVLQVVEWLHSRDRFKSYKSRYIYTTVLDVLGKAKRPTEALNIFYAMQQDLFSYPDLAAYHCIAVTLGQAGLMKELFDIMDCMRATPVKKFKLGPLQSWDPRLEPDLVIYNAVLNACVQQKQWEGAFWVLQQLKQQNIQPTNTTYGLIMEVMLACGKYNLVHEIFRKVKKTSIPSALNYKVLINCLWREGRTDEAALAVRDMETRGIVGSASLYYDLARCLCSVGRCQEALQQIDKICKVAKKPLVVTYTGLIQACLDSGSIENGTYIFNQMHKFCSPNTITYNIMLKSYIQHGMFDEAKNLFKKILTHSHQVESKIDSSQQGVPDKFTFNTMLEACAATNNWDDFEHTYQQMLHHGYHFDAKRHLRMVLDAFRAGKGEILETTWEHLARFDRVPPPPIIQERFCAKLQEDNHVAAVSCLETYERNAMHAFSEKSWLNSLKANAHRFNINTIFRLIQELRKLIAERDRLQPVYQSLLNACNREFGLTCNENLAK